jgi:hypothetical protein
VALCPETTALDWLIRKLESSEDAKERKAVVVALGTFGSAWSWDARGEEIARTRGDDLRARATAKLVESMKKLEGECGDELVDALATIAHPSGKSALERAIETGESKLAGRALERLGKAIERNNR